MVVFSELPGAQTHALGYVLRWLQGLRMPLTTPISLLFGDSVSQRQASDALWQVKGRFLVHDLRPPFASHLRLLQEAVHCEGMVFNFSEAILPPSATIQRVIEFVPQDEAAKAHARNKYKRYRALGHPPRYAHLPPFKRIKVGSFHGKNI